MTWRLVLGAIAIERRSLFGAMLMAGLVSRPTLPWWMTGVVMLLVIGAGGSAHTALGRRELAVLPVSPRELHRAGWILTVALPIALLMLARVFGGAWHSWGDTTTFAFHATPVRVMFDIAYISVIGAWIAARPDRYEPDFREDPGLYRFVVAALAMAVLPFVVIPWLPDRVGEVPVMAWVVGVVALGIALASLLRTPAASRRDSPPATAPEPTPPPVRAQAAGRSLPESRVRGIWIPMCGVAGQTLVSTVGLLVFIAVLQYVTTRAVFWEPFAHSLTDLRFLGTIGMLMLLVFGLLPGLGRWIGTLKRLPITARNLALLMSVTPAMTPVMFWSALLIIHVAATAQWPETLRLSMLMALIGVASLIDALGTKAGSYRAKMWLGFSVMASLMFAVDANRELVAAMLQHWALPLAGLLCVVLAWMVNHHTLTRSSASSRVFRYGWSNQQQRAR